MRQSLEVKDHRERSPWLQVIHHDQLEDFTVYRPATLIHRWYALTLDLAFFMPISMLLRLPFGRYLERLSTLGHPWRYYGVLLLITAIPLTCYFVAPTLMSGQTLGKRIVGLRVLTRGLSPELSLWQLFVRETFGKLLGAASLGVGFALGAVEPRGRTLHDLLAGTVVICYRQR